MTKYGKREMPEAVPEISWLGWHTN